LHWPDGGLNKGFRDNREVGCNAVERDAGRARQICSKDFDPLPDFAGALVLEQGVGSVGLKAPQSARTKERMRGGFR
jgi:hypothetical protein